MLIVSSKVICYTTLRGVHETTAERLLVHFFTGSSLDKWRTGQENSTLLPHNDVLICHRWDICTAYMRAY